MPYGANGNIMKFDPKELLWEQKYRPQTIEDCVLPTATKTFFQEMVNAGKLQKLILSRYCHGNGKSTVDREL